MTLMVGQLRQTTGTYDTDGGPAKADQGTYDTDGGTAQADPRYI